VNVLAMDTSTTSTVVGLRTADGRVLEARDDPDPTARPGHATRLLELSASLLEQGAVDWRQLQRIAVGLGPGTFTGLRIGVATARGLALSLGVELVGVSSLAALAQRARAQLDGERRTILAVLDARRGEAFAAAYDDRREIVAAQAFTPEALVELAQRLRSEGELLAVGDGALRFGSQLLEAGVEVAPQSSPLHLIGGAELCELGLIAEVAEPQKILPDYCRRPDAEIALEAAKS
jgi:tRNA threonylcarbamoyladenosine biosynthesis protein TsaB